MISYQASWKSLGTNSKNSVSVEHEDWPPALVCENILVFDQGGILLSLGSEILVLIIQKDFRQTSKMNIKTGVSGLSLHPLLPK